MTLNDISTNQRLGRRSVGNISADSKLAAYRLLLFLLLQEDIALGELITYRFIFEYEIQYFMQRHIFHFQVDFMTDVDFFAIDKGISCRVLDPLNELLQCSISQRERESGIGFLCVCLCSDKDHHTYQNECSDRQVSLRNSFHLV